MTELYAKIRTDSKYAAQRQAHGAMEYFPVELIEDGEHYHVKGGVGGRYRFVDVDLFARLGNNLLPLPTTSSRGKK